MKKAAEGIGSEQLMEDFDKTLKYGGARRISEYESELLDYLDESFDSQIKMQDRLEHSKKALESAETTLRKTDAAIDKYCSENTKKKILLEKGWQFMPEQEQEILSSASDKELVEAMKLQQVGLRTDGTKIQMQAIISNAICNGVTTEHIADSKSVEQSEKIKQDKKTEEQTKN